MNSITKLFDKYKTFEENLKQERFWLFVPVYLLKTGLKYTLTILLSVLCLKLCLIPIVYLKHNNPINTLIDMFFSFLFFTSPGYIYFIIFSKKKITLHPYIITFLFFYLIEPSQEGLFIGLCSSFVAGTSIIILQLLLIRFYKFFNKPFSFF